MMKITKILIVIARLNKGGTAKYLSSLVQGLEEKGFDIIIASGFVQDHEIEDEVVKIRNFVRINNLGRKISILNDFKARRQIKSLINSYSPDLIYSHTFKAGLLVRTLFTKIPIIHAFHGHILDDEEHSQLVKSLYIQIEKFLALRTKFIVAVGNKVRDDIINLNISNPEKTISIPPGIRVPVLRSKIDALINLKLHANYGINVSWLGRLEEVKKPERVLELAKKFPDTNFLIAGDGSRRFAIKNKLTRNVTLLGWQNSSDVYSVSDIVINTSSSEGMSLALIEAQMSGVPVVAMNVGSNSEVIYHESTGFIANHFPDEFLAYLRKLISEKDLRNTMAQTSKDWAISHFNLDLFIERHISIFRKCL